MSLRHKGIYIVQLKGIADPNTPWDTYAYWNGEHFRHVAHTKGDSGPRIPENEILEVGNYVGQDENNPG